MSGTNNYFKWLFSAFFCVVLSAATFNYIIDPYNIIRAFAIQGINTSKPATSNRTSLAKAYMITDINAQTLFIGTSSFDVGMDPDSKYLPFYAKPVFNLALPGADVYKQYRYIQHAVSMHKPKMIIMSLEFRLFLSKESEVGNYPPNMELKNYEKRLNVNYNGEKNEGQYSQYLKDLSASLLSISAIIDSIKTISSGHTVWVTQLGHSSGEARFGSEVKNKGYYSVFRDVIQGQIKTLSGRKIDPLSPQFKALEEIIRYCKEEGIELVIILPPYHAFMYELWDKANLWVEFEYWKQYVLLTVESAKSSKFDVSLWDFSTYNEVTTERVPPPSNTEIKMKWYWEPIHFKASVGDVILKNVFTHGESDIGTRLSQSTICDHLNNVRLEKNSYRNNNTKQVNLFNSIISKHTKFTNLEKTHEDDSSCP